MRTKEELVNDIYDILQKYTLTRRQICQNLGYKSKSPAPHIIVIIEQLVKEGYLIRVETETKNHLKMYKYFAK